uniref:Uncharacterized protein n=1 Tax=Echeneis naucrates TaxID=173247 RepID=A0A665W9A9_ECHNA
MKVIEHSPETLRTALVSGHQHLVKLYSQYTKEERTLPEEGLHPGKPGSLFQPITVHSESDWIVAHPEEHQDFESFYMDPNWKCKSQHYLYSNHRCVCLCLMELVLLFLSLLDVLVDYWTMSRHIPDSSMLVFTMILMMKYEQHVIQWCLDSLWPVASLNFTLLFFRVP